MLTENESMTTSSDDHSFNEIGIGDMKGNVFVDSRQSVMPPDNFQLKVIKNKKGESDIIVTNCDPMSTADAQNNHKL